MILEKYNLLNELFEYEPFGISGKEWKPTKRRTTDWASIYGVDLSGVNVRNRRKNNFSSGGTDCVKEELSDINRWNSGYWSAIMISPNKAVACKHYWRVVKGQQNSLMFMGKSGTEYRPKWKSTTEIESSDRVLIEFEEDLPVDDVKIYKCVDFRWIPSGSKVWLYDNQGRIIFKIHDYAKQFRSSEFSFRQEWHPDPVVGDICGIFSGDSGTPTFATDPVNNETYFVGNYAGGYPYYEDRAYEQKMVEIDNRISFVRPSNVRSDINRDGKIDSEDMALILADYGKTFRSGPTDVNEDGEVDGIDIGELLSTWGEVEANVVWYDNPDIIE